MPVRTLTVPTSVTTGAALAVQDMMAEKSVQFSGMSTGTFSNATIKIQSSNDNINWDDVGSAITTNDTVSFVLACQFLRCNVTSYSAGTPKAVLCGYGSGYCP